MSNYMTELELNSLKGLMHYLNTNMKPEAGVGIDVHMTDANGDSMGVVTWDTDADEFVLRFPS